MAVVKPMGTSLAASAYNKVIKVKVTPKLKSVAGYFIIVWLQIKMNDMMKFCLINYVSLLSTYLSS